MALWNQPAQEGNVDKPQMAQPAPAPTAAPVATATPAPAAPLLREVSGRAHRESVFGPGVTIEGKIEGDANIRIGGKFTGDIQIKGDLQIDNGAKITAKVNAANVTIGGHLEGNVAAAAHVSLLASADLVGDLKAATLTVAAGSRMRGHVEFGWSANESVKAVNPQADQKSHDSAKAEAAG